MYRVLIVTGVAGSGKSTVGRTVADRLGWAFVDADEFHSPEAVERIRTGMPLDDEIRRPWLRRVRAAIEERLLTGSCVIACSALKASYRAALSQGVDGVRFVFLDANADLLRQRLKARSGHFAGPQLLASQLHDLEPPADALWLDASQSVETLADTIVADVRSS